MNRNIPVYLLLFFILCGCSSKKLDIKGIWIPVAGYNPTLIISDRSIIITDNSQIREFTYILENNQVIPIDSVGKWYGTPVSKKPESYIIKKLSNDSLILTNKEYKYDFLLLKMKKISEKIQKIRLDYINGWNYGFVVNIDSAGKTKIWDEDIWKKIKSYGIASLDSISFRNLVLFSNYLYSNDSLNLRIKSCSDCPVYGLSICTNDTVKSFYFKENSKHSMISQIVLPIVDYVRSARKSQADSILRLPYSRYLGECKRIIEQKK